MPNRLSLSSVSLILFALGLSFFPAPAFAGFEWVAPADAPQAPMPAPAPRAWPSAPVATASPEIISPVIISGTASTPAPSQPNPSATPGSTPAHDTLSASSVNSNPGPAPVTGGKQAPTAMVLAPPVTISTSPASDVVHGFAKQVPLAVALRQILPPGYGFSVDPDVDLGVLISFQGGKPWRETLHDALEPAGLAMREQGQMVSVGHAGSGLVMTETAPAVAPLPAPRTVDVPLAPAPQAMDARMPTVEEWHAERGDNLHKIIEAWTQRAHVELNWVAEYDYPLQASFSYTGTFEDAVRNLLTGFQDAHPQPIAELHANPNLGLKVLIVQTRGNSYSD